MALTHSREDTLRNSSASPGLSHGLQWLWQHLVHVRHPHFLECGPIHQRTLDVLLSRGAKLYITDLITPLQQNEAVFWSRQGKKPVFLSEDFLTQLPAIPPESIAAICWGLLDLLPREALAPLLERFHACLQPGGVLFCILREPHLGAGAEAR